MKDSHLLSYLLAVMVFPHSSSQLSWPGESDEDTTTRGDRNGQEDGASSHRGRDSASYRSLKYNPPIHSSLTCTPRDTYGLEVR
jgi:hypothetical protein